MEIRFEKFLAVGNFHVDEKATNALALHPAFDMVTRQEVGSVLKKVYVVLKCMAAVLPLFPAAPKDLERGQPLPQWKTRSSVGTC